ncbi:ComEA family DNA-binding protein [Streptomyces gilvifuscus]|uniref:ComEA family DNA-binding protein n=1 Tax=Streptomyces gilvifuscus TaxID=1550617 RepID=A0ABT5FLL2_9ACTN|nr:ComEA family DNA-binding protein [Streptomyces gilvifuscus]MDC2953410.1 ComEA family DNA-binding protein [Streptomyces gilvifuscus]
MASRSRTRTATATSGPGRAPASDGRVRHRRAPVRGRAGRRHASVELRRRAQLLFPERAPDGRESGAGPPPAAPMEEADEQDLVLSLREVEDLASVAGVQDLTSVADVQDFGSAEGAVGEPEPRRAGDAWRVRAGPAVRERMPLWLQTRCGLERRSVVALSVLLVVAAVLAVQHFWAGRTESVRAPEVVRAAVPFGAEKASGEPGPGASGGAPGPVGTAGGGAEIVVDVSGKVRRPGIHRLPPGSRVTDALRAAGGVRPGTDLQGLNRARFLVDGEQVVVGGPAAPAPGPVGAAAGGPAGAAPGAPVAPVSLNTATAEQLDTLPGVGPVLAQHIVDYRTRHGGFRTVDELREVNGIGDRRFADLRNLVRP